MQQRKKKNKRILSLVEWGYPPFGGGENWLLNFSKILYNNNHDNYLICFSDPFNNKYFTEIKLIDLTYVKIIQMPKDILTIIKIIKKLNPDIINHQGVNREYFMKISNVLEIPFLTGFCFWQNIVKFNMSNINVNMIDNKNLEPTEEFNYILDNCYTYVASQFVNDIIDKLYNSVQETKSNKNLDIIETISLRDDYLITTNNNLKKYVTLINCHYNKGGYLLKYLCENLNINIPLQLIYTEHCPDINLPFLTGIIHKRNVKKNINILIPEKIDIKLIYAKTRLLIIPSLCDETFCRVAYEAMINKIPILSSNNGNLKYLLQDYAVFIEGANQEIWSKEIEKMYNDKNLFTSFESRNYYNLINESTIETKILNKIDSIKESKYKLSDNNIGIIIPWADQGLGIQGRDYYITLKELGYKPFIFSFKPYHSTHDNPYLQSDKKEWEYDNIFYSPNYRENITYDEIFDFIHKNNIKQIIIIEATFISIFKIALFIKLLNVKVYVIANIECIRMVELNYHNIFDKILTNNIESQIILSNIFKNRAKYIGFNLNYPYFKNISKEPVKKIEKFKFFCIGGLNSITRKNIDLVIKTFYNIFQEGIYLDWELNIYIQGVEIPPIINEYNRAWETKSHVAGLDSGRANAMKESDNCNNILYHINELSYKSVIDTYNKNDIFIHMGSHEGLGLGFYESIYCGTPVLTINWTPNNEIIKNNINGWLIDCEYSKTYDNDNSLINKGIPSYIILKNKIIEILINKKQTIQIINNTIKNKKNISTINKKMFEKNIISIFGTPSTCISGI